MRFILWKKKPPEKSINDPSREEDGWQPGNMSRFRKITHWIIGIIGAIIFLPVIIWAVCDVYYRRQALNAIQELRDNNEPTESADVLPPKVPDTDNMYVEMDAVFKRFEKLNNSTTNVEPCSLDEIEDAYRFGNGSSGEFYYNFDSRYPFGLNETNYQDIFNKGIDHPNYISLVTDIQNAIKKPEFNFIFFKEPNSLLHSRMTYDGSPQHLSKKGGITYSCEIVLWYAVASAERNNLKLSLSIVNTCSTMINKTYYTVNTDSGVFCEIYIHEHVLDTIRRICNTTRLSTEQYQLLYENIKFENPTNRFIAALKGERVFAIEHYQAEYNGDYDNHRDWFMNIAFKPIYSGSFINSIKVSNLWIEIISNNPPHIAMSKILDVESQYYKKGFFYSRPYKYFYLRYLACQSRTIAFQLGLAIEIFRNKYNKYPETLENLVPEIIDSVPLDPYNGKPYHYEITDNDITVFSEGRNDSDKPNNDTDINKRLIWRTKKIIDDGSNQ